MPLEEKEIKLLESYRNEGIRLAYRMIGNREDAIDVVQEAMMSICGRSNLTDIKGYLIKSIIYKTIDLQRKNRKKKFDVSLSHYDSNTEPLADKLESRSENPEDILLAKELLYELIDHLPPLYIDPILLLDEGYSYNDIARLSDIPVGTVKSRINRGRSRAQQILEEYNAKI